MSKERADEWDVNPKKRAVVRTTIAIGKPALENARHVAEVLSEEARQEERETWTLGDVLEHSFNQWYRHWAAEREKKPKK